MTHRSAARPSCHLRWSARSSPPQRLKAWRGLTQFPGRSDNPRRFHMSAPWNDQTEWLETDGLGGFASGTAGGIRTRRYHGLLLAATSPPSGRVMLVNGVEVWATTPAGRFPLSSQRYEGQVVAPEGFRFVRSFTTDPWPTWRFHLPDGTVIEQASATFPRLPTPSPRTSRAAARFRRGQSPSCSGLMRS